MNKLAPNHRLNQGELLTLIELVERDRELGLASKPPVEVHAKLLKKLKLQLDLLA